MLKSSWPDLKTFFKRLLNRAENFSAPARRIASVSLKKKKNPKLTKTRDPVYQSPAWFPRKIQNARPLRNNKTLVISQLDQQLCLFVSVCARPSPWRIYQCVHYVWYEWECILRSVDMHLRVMCTLKLERLSDNIQHIYITLSYT